MAPEITRRILSGAPDGTEFLNDERPPVESRAPVISGAVPPARLAGVIDYPMIVPAMVAFSADDRSEVSSVRAAATGVGPRCSWR
jgi:hypothetical protein